MTRRGSGARGMAVLAVLAAMIAGGEARAGIVIVKGTTVQTGDPTYEYIFTVELQANSTLDSGGYFTIYDLPGIPPDALHSEPNIHWGASIQDIGITPTDASPPIPDSPTIENITWQWNGATMGPFSTDQILGNFVVGSTIELSSPPTPTLIYVGSLDGVHQSNQGTITVTFVPEPTSIILLSTAAVFTLSVYARGRRRRPAAPTA
jgi:hypothetical protein